MTAARHAGRARVAWLAVALGGAALVLSLPPLRSLIERSMVWHMVVQMPLLVAAGWAAAGGLAGSPLDRRLAPWNRYGLTGLLATLVITAYWMLPSAIDRAVVQPLADLAKLATLATAGALLRHGFERAPLVLQMFCVGYGVSMLVGLGLYFAASERRLCNAYSLATQANAGAGIVALGLALGGCWLLSVLRPGRRRPGRPRRSAA